MKKYHAFLLPPLVLLLAVMISVCFTLAEGQAEEHPAGKKSGSDSSASGEKQEAMEWMFKGKVMEAIDAGRYAFVQIDTGEKKLWVAVPDFDGKPGDQVLVPPGVPVADFHSKKLNRDFEMIYFVSAIHLEGEIPAKQSPPSPSKDGVGIHAPVQNQMPHPPMDELTHKPVVEIGKIEKAEGGQTVSEIIMDRKNLAGKSIRVRARVVKYTPNIMGKNWLHVRDGSGIEGENDLIVTTAAVVKVGDVVLVRGKVTVDLDLGLGLKYRVVIENADVTVEQRHP